MPRLYRGTLKRIPYPSNLLFLYYAPETAQEIWESGAQEDLIRGAEKVVEQFTEPYRAAIRGHFKECKTYRVLGNELGLTHERVRQRIDKVTREIFERDVHLKCWLTLGLERGERTYVSTYKASDTYQYKVHDDGRITYRVRPSD